MHPEQTSHYFRTATEAALTTVSRRRFLGGLGAATAAAAFLAACGSEDDPTATPSATGDASTSTATSTAASTETPAAGEGFTFTDDRGVTVTLPTRPERVVAQADSAAALADLGIKPIATFGEALPADQPALASRGLGDIESVGEVWAEIDVEKLASLKPDLVVTRLYPSTDPPIIWGIADEMVATIEQIAPIVTIDMLKVATHGMQRFAELAEVLGSDLDAPDVAGDIKRFEDASEAVRAAASAKAGLTVLALSATPDEVYVARPEDHPDLAYFAELGLDLVVPDTDERTWEVLSWEQMTKYPADLILVDARDVAGVSASWDAFQASPVVAQLPSVAAGQVAEWHAAPIPSYGDFADNLEALAATIEAADATLVA